MRRLTDSEVKEGLAKEGYQLLSPYINAATKIKTICPKGHEYECVYSSFQQGHRCCTCAGQTPWNLNMIQKELEKEGYILLAKDYKGVHSRLAIECPKGHHGTISWASFQRGNKCKTCGVERRAQGRKIDIEEIRRAIESEGYQLLSTEYGGPNKKLQAICPKGHEYHFQWYRFTQGVRCKKCAFNAPWTYEGVKKFIEAEGFKIHSTKYEGSHGSLEVECPKGHSYQVLWTNFQQGYRCPDCGEWQSQRMLGEILKKIYPTTKILKQENLGFLEKQRADFAVPEHKMVVEYDGVQHFQPLIGPFGVKTQEEAENRFKEQKRWDKTKNRLCKKNGWKIIRIKYNEDLTLEHIKKRIENE